MTTAPLRVAFAGLAHSHPYTDAAGALSLGAEVIGAFDPDACAFVERFGGTVAATVPELVGLRPDLIIATPRPWECVPLLNELRAAGSVAPVFFNKVVAATAAQLSDWDAALDGASMPVGTASVLRFAPALERLAIEVADVEVLAIRVHAQHDNAGFRVADRSWQDDPESGGGTLVTVGVHAWEMVDRVFPGAVLETGSGWTRRGAHSTTRSEDAAGLDGRVRIGDGSIPVQFLVTGTSGPDAYRLEVVAADGIRSVELEAGLEPLGFTGLIRALLSEARHGRVAAAWSQERTVVSNTIRAAQIARGR